MSNDPHAAAAIEAAADLAPALDPQADTAIEPAIEPAIESPAEPAIEPAIESPAASTPSEPAFPMLAPSLRPGRTDAEVPQPPAKTVSETTSAGVTGLAEIERIWPAYLTRLETVVPKFLVLQMQRARLADFNADGLHLAVDQEFGARMVDEHLQVLMDLLKELTGQRIRIRTRIERSGRRQSTDQDPYEQFRMIQQKDPIVREIVELFGAELRYE